MTNSDLNPYESPQTTEQIAKRQKKQSRHAVLAVTIGSLAGLFFYAYFLMPRMIGEFSVREVGRGTIAIVVGAAIGKTIAVVSRNRANRREGLLRADN